MHNLLGATLGRHFKPESLHITNRWWPIAFGERSNKGSTLIEFALVFPVMVLVIIGTVEIGLAFKDYLTVGALSREGARIAALAGNDSEGDCAVLKGIGTLASADELSRLGQVEIFEANVGTGAPVPTEINSAVFVGPGTDQCHFESPLPDDDWQFTAQPYLPSERNTIVGSENLELVGVRVTMAHNWITGFPPFRGSFEIEESTITRVEPKAFEDG